MKLSKFKTLPKRMGGIKFDFTSEPVSPTRTENVVRLPFENNNVLYMIRHKKHFLFQCCSYSCGDSRFVTSSGETYTYWFGGMDGKNPFLTQITSDAFSAYEGYGTKDFYYYLRPEVIEILKMSLELGVRGIKRQGSVWAYPLPFSWRQLELLLQLNLAFIDKNWSYATLSSNEKSKEKKKVLGSSHTIEKGRYWEDTRHAHLYDIKVPVIADGILSSPKHEPIELRCPHVLVRTNGLWK